MVVFLLLQNLVKSLGSHDWEEVARELRQLPIPPHVSLTITEARSLPVCSLQEDSCLPHLMESLSLY